MKPLFTSEEFENSKSSNKLPCQCYFCNETFYIKKNQIMYELQNKRGRIKFCSPACLNNFNKKDTFEVGCTNCGTPVLSKKSERKKTPNRFCSHSCSATYNNKNKKTGIRRSKLESWIEAKLSELYPNLDIKYNSIEAIKSELDIYIPSLNIAFELNGIFHYEPIFGVDKLEKIQNNDSNKFKLCIESKIDLCIIDTSKQKYVKESTSQQYLDIITNIINQRLLNE